MIKIQCGKTHGNGGLCVSVHVYSQNRESDHYIRVHAVRGKT